MFESFSVTNRISLVFLFLEFKLNPYPVFILIVFNFQSQATVNFGALIALIGQTVWCFIFIFIYCELGQRVNEAFDESYDTILQFNLYSFPMEIQRMLPIIILNAQQSVEIRGYGDFSCTRERFKSVSRIVFSNTLK